MAVAGPEFAPTPAFSAGQSVVDRLPCCLVGAVPLLMLRGHHLAFGTLATHLIFLSVIGEASVAGGDVGLQGIPRLNVGSVTLDSTRSYAYLSACALLFAAIVAANVLGRLFAP